MEQRVNLSLLDLCPQQGNLTHSEFSAGGDKYEVFAGAKDECNELVVNED
jgi:hypothetical protein